MILIKFIRGLFAVPFSILAWVCKFFAPPMSCQLFSIAWSVSGNYAHAIQALAMKQKAAGLNAAVLQARAMLEKRPSSELAAMAGVYELMAGNKTQAKECLAIALGSYDPTGMAEYLQFGLADEQEILELAKKWKYRKDLSAATKQRVLVTLMLHELECGNIPQAVERAKYITSINDEPCSMLVMWGWYVQAENFAKADEIDEKIKIQDAGLLSFKLFVAECFNLEHVIPTLREQLEQLNPQAAAAIRSQQKDGMYDG